MMAELIMARWWDEINESTRWQDDIFFTLSAAYALVSLIALVQLLRIRLRVPENGWSTQKVFHLMNVIVNGVRAAIFGFHMLVFVLKPRVLTLILLDLPGLLFFTTYTLLVLFWAEIYYQAKSLPTDKLRAWYLSVNCVIYVIQVFIWIYLWTNANSFIESISQVFIAVVSFIAALGFLLYGGGLFFMLRRFPIESKGRRKKLHELCVVLAVERSYVCIVVDKELGVTGLGGLQRYVSLVFSFVASCFIIILYSLVSHMVLNLCHDSVRPHGNQVAVSAFDANLSLKVLNQPILDFIYYSLVEILPSALVLFILRKLPPKRVSSSQLPAYHPIR